jgi:hypothetical protein
MAAALVILLIGATAGAVVARRVAGRVAFQMSWYACRGCGVRFHCRAARERCPACAAIQDQAGFSRALADFAGRYRELQ